MPVHETPVSALYNTIHRQPAVVSEVLQRVGVEAERATGLLAGARRIFLVGTGTSSHAAIVGEHLLRLAGAEAYATTSFDFAVYPRPIGPDDAVIAISHRGSKRYGAATIARARDAGAHVVGLTGQGSPMEGPDVVIATAPQEISATHTASYTATLAALALIAADLGERMGVDVAALREALGRLPATISALLASEDEARPVAAALAERGRLVLVGAGPNAATAREGALKVKESSYLVAEGFELETALHGGLQAVEAGDIAVVVAAHGPALDRTGDAARALGLIGARLLIVADERVLMEQPFLRNAADTLFTYAPVPEALSPLPAVVPLQLLAAFTAQRRGSDPDSFRADDPVYKRATGSYTL